MMLRSVLLLCTLIISTTLTGQISDSQILKIDSLFLEWNKPNHPGGSIGITLNDELVYSKAYGLASLEYNIPNTPETIFNTGSVSKQFTAMGIILLHQQGKLSVDDNIRKYLPDLPEFAEKVTIRHMLHHTSGMRSLHAMLGLAGWRSDDSRTNKDLYRFMLKQKDLNFTPGSEYLYCNTGYMLMVNIIENVTGQKFTDWIKATVFIPLGMNNTYFEDTYSRIVPNNATSYRGTGKNGFERAVEYWGYIGSGNMHSTTNDLLKWLGNFTNPQEGWKESFALMQTIDPLNDGSENDYAFGVVVDNYLGERRIQHGGSIGGFRAFVAAFPDAKLNIAVLTNFSSSNTGGKVGEIAKNVLGLTTENNAVPITSNTSQESIKMSSDKLVNFEGHYWSDKEFSKAKIFAKNDTLRILLNENSEYSLTPIDTTTFKVDVAADVKLRFDQDENGQKSLIVIESGVETEHYEYYNSKTMDSRDLSQYIGSYYSPELETSYSIYMDDDKLKWYHSRHGDYPLNVLKKDKLKGNYPFLDIRFSRNQNGNVDGIFVTNGRVRNLWFEKRE